MNLYHITRRQDWIAARRDGTYVAPSLSTEGFIHCSTSSQVVEVARQFYAGQSGLVLLVIDPDRLVSALKWEPPADGLPPAGVAANARFPHVHGPINLDAVVDVLAFEPDASGQFRRPDVLGAPSDPDHE